MPKYLTQAGLKKQCKKQMRLCVTKFSSTGFSASKGFQRNLIFCSNEATVYVFWAFFIKSRKREENHRKKIRSERTSQCYSVPVLLRDEEGFQGASFQAQRTLGMRQALRHAQHLPHCLPHSSWSTVCSCSPSLGQTPCLCPSLMAGICISCLYENKCYFTLQKCFPKRGSLLKIQRSHFLCFLK